MSGAVTVTPEDWRAFRGFIGLAPFGVSMNVRCDLGANPEALVEALARHRQQSVAAFEAREAELVKLVEEAFREAYYLGQNDYYTCAEEWKWSDAKEALDALAARAKATPEQGEAA